ncbi:prepilin-type N-terminal cleavage/methylation domain-containing protein [Aquibacillus koreensis]|uniref:ComG operon protein 3 n=1 Tax=Aquibacillus koreensis TaxID=279446 RepID=A0A9X3WKD0_9BACI|nr:competence type IV pilus major pilin ComGC [Aquibacillus koreensis]MCT2537548.1 competence type IV pilus major pilin ComGC [Aquibacillus koreensis]MDC3418994.1 prepilin-type N-terminal cleavage/methylation domain-containing protein [Aquibacillus koreensis]
MRKEHGFTLIEMLIVLTVISVLLILLVPNLADKNKTMQDNGCNALKQMAESQILSYKIDKGASPSSIEVLIQDDYLKDDTCANGAKKIQLSSKDEDIVDIVDIGTDAN